MRHLPKRQEMSTGQIYAPHPPLIPVDRPPLPSQHLSETHEPETLLDFGLIAYRVTVVCLLAFIAIRLCKTQNVWIGNTVEVLNSSSPLEVNIVDR